MPIRVKYYAETGEYRPVIICDVCGKLIERHVAGNYHWDTEIPAVEGDPDHDSDGAEYDLLFAHKESGCARRLIESTIRSGGSASDMCLSTLLVTLPRNLDAEIDHKSLGEGVYERVATTLSI